MSNIYFCQNVNSSFQPFVLPENKGVSPYEKKEKESKFTLYADIYEKYNDRKKRRRRNSIIAITSSATLVAAAVAVMATGKSQVVSKKIQKIFGGVESKFSNIKDKHLHKFLTVTFGFFDRMGKIITNSSPIKDYTLYQTMGKTKVTAKLRDVITDFFTKENRNSVLKSVKKSRESYNEFIASVENSVKQSENNPNLIKDHVCFAELKKLMGQARNTPDFLLPHYFEDVYSGMNKDMDYLSQEVNFKRLFSKEAFQGFVPENILLGRRSKYAKALFEKKNDISCSFSDISAYAKDRLDETNIVIYSIKDSKIQKSLKDCSITLENSLTKYVKDSKNKENRTANLEAIQQNIKKFKKEVNLLGESEIKQNLNIHLDEYAELFKNHSPGVLQDIRVLAGKVWGDNSNFDLQIKKTAGRHAKDLNLSLNRMINMFDKQRDITLGSGPSDVLGLLAPIGLFAWGLNRADSKDKKVGVTLEAGIPILGGMLIYLRTLALQYNGVKALATSFGTGLLLNLAGTLIYKKYMAIQDLKRREQSQFATPQQL